MKMQTTQLETIFIILGIVSVFIILFLLYRREHDHLQITRNEDGRLQIEE